MTRDDIIRMAREAGFSEAWLSAGENPPHFEAPAVIVERFFNLAVAAEREACAKVCESYDDDSGAGEAWAFRFAQFIRARGEK